MDDKPTSPFAGLDKALLRSTKQSPPAPPEKTPQRPAKPKKNDTTTPRYHDTTVSTMQPRNHTTMVSPVDGGIFDVVRKAVKQSGKEAATHRFTLDERTF